jgi:gliding motility-associated-like protein
MDKWMRIGWLTAWLVIGIVQGGYSRSSLAALQPPKPVVALTISSTGTLAICTGTTTQIQTNAGTVLDASVNWHWLKDGVKIPGKERVNPLDIKEPGLYALGGDWETDPAVVKPKTLTVTMLPAPEATIQPLSESVCRGQSFSLSASPTGVGTNYAYRWENEAGATVQTGRVLSTSITGAYTLNVTNPTNNCSYRVTAPASLVPAKDGYKVSFTATGKTTFCEGNSVDLVWKPADPNVPSSIVWYKGTDALSDPINTTLITAREAGSYSLRDIGNSCFSAPPPIVVVVGQPPAVQIDPSQRQVCKGRAYTLRVLPANASYQYEWFDQTTERPLFNANGLNSGSYTTTDEGPFKVKISTPQGCTTTLSSEAYVDFLPSTTLSISPTGGTPPGTLSVCAGTSATLTVSGGDVSDYYWTRNGTAKVPGSDGQDRIIVNQAGTYSIGGPLPTCVSVANTPVVTIQPIPTSTIVASSGVVCKGDAFSLFALPAVANRKYDWTNAAGQAVTFPTTQTGTFGLRVTSPAGCIFTATSANVISFRSLTAVAITASSSLSFCPGVGVTLSVPTNTPRPYSWARNNLLIAGTGNAAGVNAAQAGTYTLVGLPACARVSDPAVVALLPQPTVSILPSSLTLCEGDRATLSAQTAQANTLRWRVNGVDPGPVRSLTANAATTVSLTVTNPQGCTRATGLTYTPQTFPKPTVDITSPDPIWQNRSVEAGVAPPTPGYRYDWFPTEGVSDPKRPRPTFRPAETTSYTLVVTDQRGCQANDTLTVTVWAQLVIPTVFTPNADGENDTWKLPNIDRYPNAEVTVYNRWGEVVYAGLAAKQQPFDGTKGGQPLPDGQYMYHIRLNFGDVETTGRLLITR